MARRATFRIVSIAAMALTANCASEESADESRAEASDTTAAPGPVEVTITASDYAFDAPDTVSAGWLTFRLANQGSQPHMAQLVRLDPGVTVEAFLSAYEEAFRTAGPRPEWARRLGGPSVAIPQDTTNATLRLEPGPYVWICLFNLPDGIPHVVEHGMALSFVVVEEVGTIPRNPPEADVVVQLTDYAFALSAPLRPGQQTIRVVNEGAESHEISIVKLADGKSMDDVRAWARDPALEPPLDLRNLEGVTSLAPGAQAYFEIDLPPGDYALLCFVTAPDGRSHIEHGMIQETRVG